MAEGARTSVGKARAGAAIAVAEVEADLFG